MAMIRNEGAMAGPSPWWSPLSRYAGNFTYIPVTARLCSRDRVEVSSRADRIRDLISTLDQLRDAAHRKASSDPRWQTVARALAAPVVSVKPVGDSVFAITMERNSTVQVTKSTEIPGGYTLMESTRFRQDGNRTTTGSTEFFLAGSHVRLEGSRNNDALVAGSHVIADGREGDDVIVIGDRSEAHGGDGNDSLVGGELSRAIGGSGNDTLVVGDRSVAHGEAGNDTLVVGNRSQAFAGKGDDTITGGQQSWVVGDTGNDALTAGDGSRVDGGEGNDTLIAGTHCAVLAGDGDDTVKAGDFSRVTGGAGNDHVEIGDSAYVGGGEGNDTVKGGDAAMVLGEAGDDRIELGHHAFVEGGEGDDTITTGVHSDIRGGNGKDHIVVGGGSWINGGSGDDDITLVGSAEGSLSDNRVVFRPGDGHDSILTADPAIGVTLELSNEVRKSGIRALVDGDTLRLQFNEHDSITLVGWTSKANPTIHFDDGTTTNLQSLLKA